MKRLIMLLLLVPCICWGETDIEIKGIKIGMNKYAYEQIIASQSNFTIAGIKSLYAKPVSKYDNEGKLDSFMFFFDSSDFLAMQNVILDKFQEMKCDKKTLSNAYGAKFEDIICSASYKTGILELKKYVNLETSVLALRSHKFDLNEERNRLLKKQERAKDL